MKASNRNIVLRLIDNKNIRKENLPKILKELEIIPSSSSWYGFIDQLLLWFGTLSLAFAVMFFMAYNWTEMGHLFKFALVEGLIVMTMGVYWYLGGETLSSKATLMASVILLGVLLALVGQTYQTGADPWQLFFYWAVLMLPWAIVGRFSAIWILFIFLMNLSIFLYMETFGRLFGFSIYSDSSVLWIFSLFNTSAFVIWEGLKNHFEWLDSSWAIRLLGFVSMVGMTWLVLAFIWEEASAVALLVWVAWLAGIYWVYRVLKIDLFMLSLGALSFSIVVVNILVQIISWRYLGIFYIFLIGLTIVGLGAGFASWLKTLQKEVEDARS